MEAAMISRFDKALEQVARAGSDLKADRMALESRARKVRRLEELIRAKEAMGDRIVIGIGAALVVSAMALPVYAAYFSDGYSYLPIAGGPIATRGSLAEERLQALNSSAGDPATTGSVASASKENSEGSTSRQAQSEVAPFARFVIHRATEASALIEGPNGLWWVTPGMKIPGAGQILSIEHSDTGWAVITSETTITEAVSAR
jgi:hypothetical protein